MDFKIDQNEIYPMGYMSFTKNSDITTNIFNLLTIKKGSFFADPSLGCQYVKTITPQNINLQKRHIESALKPLLDSKRAQSINVIVEPDDNDIYQINIRIEAIQADGIPIIYQSYISVGGPSATWTPV